MILFKLSNRPHSNQMRLLEETRCYGFLLRAQWPVKSVNTFLLPNNYKIKNSFFKNLIVYNNISDKHSTVFDISLNQEILQACLNLSNTLLRSVPFANSVFDA